MQLSHVHRLNSLATFQKPFLNFQSENEDRTKTRYIKTPTNQRDIYEFYDFLCFVGPPLWSSGQSFWLQIQRFRVRFPALPDFLSSSGSGTGSTQPREVN